MNTLETIALRRLGLILGSEGAQTTPQIAAALMAELAHVGVRIVNPDKITDQLVSQYKEIAEFVKKLRGMRRTYSPLFSGFPDKLPDFDLAALRFLIGSVRLVSQPPFSPTDQDIRDAMDFSDIGWWPASSVPQDIDKARLDRAIEELKVPDSTTQWASISIVDSTTLTNACKTYMADCFASATSLREDVSRDLELLARYFGVHEIDPETVRFRENRVLLFKVAWERHPETLSALSPTPDDLLRLFASLTDSDVSLTEKIRFPKFTKAQRRIIVRCLETTPRLSDVFRRRGMWLAIDRGLHVGEYDAPKTREVFACLRSQNRDSTSFGSRFERALKSGVYIAALVMAFNESPTTLVRQARRLMSLATGPIQRGAFLEILEEAAPKVPLRVLLAAESQVRDNGRTYPRISFTKKGAPLVIDNKKNHLRVGGDFANDTIYSLSKGIYDQVSLKDSWKGEWVYIDPALHNVLLPTQLRSTAQGLVQVERGTSLPSGTDKARVVRLFVHWKDSESNSTDLDLSCVALDEDFQIVDHVSYTRLTNAGMVHSGDLTSAPTGAEEFIDIDIATAQMLGETKGWKYLAPMILRYSGDKFGDLDEVNVGWMLRNEASSDRKTFDPSTVVNAFELSGGLRTAIPMVLDLKAHKVMYSDIYIPGQEWANVERDGAGAAELMRHISNLYRIRPTVEQLAYLHLDARDGILVEDRESASITFGLDADDTYSALHPEKIISELL